MVTCKQCVFWDRQHIVDENPLLRYCNHPKCESQQDNRDGFGVVDGEPFNAGTFAAGPDFGCIHGEQKI